MTKHNGGPAFPVPESAAAISEPGMSLRDWFAGQVIATMYELSIEDLNIDEMASDAYLVADAMLAGRAKEGTDE